MQNKQKGYTVIELLIMFKLIIVVALLIGWCMNVYDICTQYPKLAEWEAKHVICTIGIAAVPVGGVCGYMDVH